MQRIVQCINFIIKFQPTGSSMLTNPQRFREYREGTSPFRERSTNRSTTRTPLPENHTANHQNGSFQYGRARHEVSDHQMKANERPYSGNGSQNVHQNLSQNAQNQEKHSMANFRNKRQYQNYSCFQETDSSVGHKRSKMNDFSFEEEFGHQPSQANITTSKRENARTKGLEIKMNNIESLNEKINNLLSMVKKDKSRDKLEIHNETYNRKPNEPQNKSNFTLNRPLIQANISKQKENAYSYQIMEKQQRQKIDKYGMDHNYQSPFKNKPLQGRQQNFEVRQQIRNRTNAQRHQRSTIEIQKDLQYKQTQYSPLPRYRRGTVNLSENNGQQSNQNKNYEIYQAATPSVRKDRPNISQPHQKSIEEMLNERRLQRGMIQGEKSQKYHGSVNLVSAPSYKNTPKHEKAAQTVKDEAERINSRPLNPASNNSQINQIRERIAKLSNPTKEQNERVKVEDKSPGLTGRIYKKSEGVTPPRPSYTHKKTLQLDVNLF